MGGSSLQVITRTCFHEIGICPVESVFTNCMDKARRTATYLAHNEDLIILSQADLSLCWV